MTTTTTPRVSAAEEVAVAREATGEEATLAEGMCVYVYRISTDTIHIHVHVASTVRVSTVLRWYVVVGSCVFNSVAATSSMMARLDSARLDSVVAAGRDTAVTEGTGTGTGGTMRTGDMEGGSPTLSQGRMNTATECR